MADQPAVPIEGGRGRFSVVSQRPPKVNLMAEHHTCPSCSSDDLFVVVLSPAGTPMRFATCRHCERRWWEDELAGSAIGLDTVIEHIAG